MTLKVLVFESDPAFAEELRTELDARGFATTVVDDGNVGLQKAAAEKPDLVLLSIELPRMNGFSVCNKLKKDPALRDVPLIIMSSESSDETFEQHKKLRTRAEAYVHKPIAFGDLLNHIRQFVSIGGGTSADSDGPILIEDEIEVGSDDYLLEDEVESSAGDSLAEALSDARVVSAAALESAIRPDDADAAPLESVPPSKPPSVAPAAAHAAGGDGGASRALGPDFEDAAESALGRLVAMETPAPAEASPAPPANGASGVSISSRPPMGSTFPRRASLRPSALGGDPVEQERLRAETVALREQLETAQRELSEARREADKLRIEAREAARLSREGDELRAKLAAASKSGGISSRDFLDLRETLNKKDKEILSFREQLSRKDRDIVESQDRALGLERAKADVEERLLLVERELAETKDVQEGLTAERDVAKRAADDMRGRLDQAKTDLDARERQLSELRGRNADERAANEVKLAAIRAELDQVLASERSEHARSLDQAEQRRRADVEQLRRERDAAFAETREQAEHEKRDALSAQAVQLQQENDAKASAAQRAHLQEIDRVRAEGASEAQAALEAARVKHAEEARVLSEERDARVASIEERLGRDLTEAREAAARGEAELGSTRKELQELIDRKRSEDNVSLSRVGELEQRLAELQGARDALDQGLAAANDRAAALQSELEGLRRELAETKDRLVLEVSRSDHTRAKWDADRQSLDRAKDALAVALAQIEEAEARPLA